MNFEVVFYKKNMLTVLSEQSFCYICGVSNGEASYALSFIV